MNNTRKKILDAVITLLETNNYQNMTTAVIAEASGTSEGSIFRCFKNKRGVFIAALQDCTMRIPKGIFKNIEKEEDLQNKFAIIAENFYQMFAENRFFYNVIYKGYSELKDPKIRILLKELLYKNLGEIKKIFIEANKTGKYHFDADIIEFFALGIWGMAKTLIKQSIVNTDFEINEGKINGLLNPFLKITENFKCKTRGEND